MIRKYPKRSLREATESDRRVKCHVWLAKYEIVTKNQGLWIAAELCREASANHHMDHKELG